MLKCPLPGCPVIVSPEKNLVDIGAQKGALMRHLMGEPDESAWVGCEGHEIPKDVAREIADRCEEIARLVAAQD